MDDDERVRLSDVPSIADESWATRNGQADTHIPESWQPLNLADLPDQDPVQPTLGDIGIVYPGKRHVFSGPQESAKTLVAYGVALKITANGGDVVLIDFEMGRYDARNRLHELGATPNDLGHIHYVEPAEKATTGAIATLLALQPQLVIIDAAAGAYDLQGLDDNRRQDVEKFTGIYVRSFWLAEIATIVLDHVVKSSEHRGSYAIGSERKVAGSDVHLGFEAINPITRGGTGLYKITTHKDRQGYLKRGKLAEIEINSDPASHELTWTIKPVAVSANEDQTTFRPTHLMERVSVWLEIHNEPASQNQIETNVKGKAGFVRAAIVCLFDEGYLKRIDGPRGAKMFIPERPYREMDDLTSSSSPPRPHLVPDEDMTTSSTSSPATMKRDEGRGQSGDGTVSPRPDLYDEKDFSF